MEIAQQMHVYHSNKFLFTKLETRLLQMKLIIDRTNTCPSRSNEKAFFDTLFQF